MPHLENDTPHLSCTREYWDTTYNAHITTAQETFETQFESFNKWVNAGVETIKRGNKIILFGNGGSAADAQHIAAEMSVKLRAERPPIAALCLTLDSSALTACANDFGFDQIFARQLQALGQNGDMAVGLSTSGNSANILNALETAKQLNLTTIGLSGKTGGKMPPLCDITLKVPATDPGRIQEMHITLGHMFVGVLEQKLNLI